MVARALVKTMPSPVPNAVVPPTTVLVPVAAPLARPPPERVRVKPASPTDAPPVSSRALTVLLPVSVSVPASLTVSFAPAAASEVA